MARLKVRFLEKLYYGKNKFAIVFPNTFELGAVNLAPHILFRQLNQFGLADIFFLDSDGGIRTGLPLNEFDVIFFTLPYEVDFSNVLEILTKYNIPVFRDQRSDVHPLIVAGGITVTSNPFPVFPFIDIFLLGESEVSLTGFLEIYTPDRMETIKRASDLEFAMIPGEKETAKRVFVSDLQKFLTYSSFISESVFGEAFLAEIVRGCPWKCRFCLLSYVTLPPRFVPSDVILKTFERYVKPGDHVGLVGSALGDHPEFFDILKFLREKDVRVSVSSLRIETVTLDNLRLLKESGMKTMTVAIEAGTERLRWRINKPIRDEHIESMAKLAREAGILKIKVYFMIGLPGETLEDIEGIGKTIKLIRDNFRGPVSVTISPFVPKPHTPFGDYPLWSEGELKKKLRKLKIDPRVKVSVGSPRLAVVQAVLSRGDDRVGEALYYGFKNRIGLLSSMKKLGLDPDKYLYDEKYFSEAPYKGIDTGVTQWFLNFERTRSERGRILGPCKPEVCSLCGVCKPRSAVITGDSNPQ